jgi:hypothetical protein
VTRVRGARGAAALLAVPLVLAACGGGEDPSFGATDDSTPTVETSAGVTTTLAGGATSTTAPTTTTLPVPEDGDVEVSSTLPEGWPDDLPVPDDAVLELGQRTEQDDDRVLLTADFTVPDEGANVYTAFLRALEADSATTILQRSSGDTEAGFVGSASFERPEYSGNFAVDTATGETTLTVSVVLTP